MPNKGCSEIYFENSNIYIYHTNANKKAIDIHHTIKLKKKYLLKKKINVVLTICQSHCMSLSTGNLYNMLRCQRPQYLGNGLHALTQLMSKLPVGVRTPSKNLPPLIQRHGVCRSASYSSYVVSIQSCHLL